MYTSRSCFWDNASLFLRSQLWSNNFLSLSCPPLVHKFLDGKRKPERFPKRALESFAHQPSLRLGSKSDTHAGSAGCKSCSFTRSKQNFYSSFPDFFPIESAFRYIPIVHFFYFFAEPFVMNSD